jgi:hypothetical protein
MVTFGLLLVAAQGIRAEQGSLSILPPFVLES